MFEAVSRLGFYEAYCIVAALMASRTMSQVRANYSLDANQLWRHTVTTAVIAAILAKRVQVLEAAAFPAGLLHDIGKLIFVSVEGVTYAEMVRKSGVFGHALVIAEDSRLWPHRLPSRSSSFPCIPPNPPLLKTQTTSPPCALCAT